jgi:hypothetical protein
MFHQKLEKPAAPFCPDFVTTNQLNKIVVA